MPLPFALLIGFALGVALAQAAKAELARAEGPLVTTRAIAVVGAFAALVFAPIAGYAAAFHGDWAYLYAVPWRSVPSAVDLVLAAFAGAVVLLGFVVAAPYVRARNVRSLTLLAGAPAAAALVLLVVSLRRLAVSASYVQFHSGFGVEPITSSALGRSVLWSAFALLAGVTWALRQLRGAR